jgi:hypothetical protein
MVITLSPCFKMRQDGLNTLVNFRSESPSFTGQFSTGSNTKADVARYDALLKKLAVAAIAAMPMLMAAASNQAPEVAYGAP